MDKVPTVEDLLRAALAGLPRAERLLANHVLTNYPVSALASINQLAIAARVSAPTVVRLAQRLGFRGYPDLQNRLRSEVEALLVTPMAKYDRQKSSLPETHVLQRIAAAVVENIHATLSGIAPQEFDKAAALLADPTRAIYAIGGRITHSVADYFCTTCKVIRPGVTLLSDQNVTWAPALIDLKPGDVILVFDIRRYENAILQVVELAREQGAEVIVVTDRWHSPACAFAGVTLAAHVEAPSAWDSNAVLIVLVEALLAAIQEGSWTQTEQRLLRMEALYARTFVFRRHR